MDIEEPLSSIENPGEFFSRAHETPLAFACAVRSSDLVRPWSRETREILASGWMMEHWSRGLTTALSGTMVGVSLPSEGPHLFEAASRSPWSDDLARAFLREACPVPGSSERLTWLTERASGGNGGPDYGLLFCPAAWVEWMVSSGRVDATRALDACLAQESLCLKAVERSLAKKDKGDRNACTGFRSYAEAWGRTYRRLKV